MTRSLQGITLGAVVAFAAFASGGACVHTHATPPPPAAVAATKADHELGAETGTPVASTPQGLMHDGAEKKIQERLLSKGLLTAGQCTGQFNTDTREALRRFQKSEGLPATGLPSYETVDHLGLALKSIFRSTDHAGDVPPSTPPHRAE
ncbi:MAG: putative peptidoglycan binding domain [Myxococcales bacterium]|nr:putative peptidoglycan binding domain [Myxococcales bacterium]